MCLCGCVSDVNDPIQIAFHLLFFLFLATLCRCSLISCSVVCLHSFLCFYFLGPITVTIALKQQSRLSNLFQLDLCTGAAGALGRECCCRNPQVSAVKNLTQPFIWCNITHVPASQITIMCTCEVDKGTVLICCSPHQHLAQGEMYCNHDNSQ